MTTIEKPIVCFEASRAVSAVGADDGLGGGACSDIGVRADRPAVFLSPRRSLS